MLKGLVLGKAIPATVSGTGRRSTADRPDVVRSILLFDLYLAAEAQVIQDLAKLRFQSVRGCRVKPGSELDTDHQVRTRF